MDADEAALHGRVVAALRGLPGVDVEIDRTTVILRGKVTDVAVIARAEERAANVDGVGSVINRLVVGT